MKEKIKLPLTALFGFAIGAVVFYPLGTISNITEQQLISIDSVAVTAEDINSDKNAVVNKITNTNQAMFQVAKLSDNSNTKLVQYLFPKDESTTSKKVKIQTVSDIVTKTAVIRKKRIIVKKINYKFSKEAILLSNNAIKQQLFDETLIQKESEVASFEPEIEEINIDLESKIDNVDLEIAEFSAGIGATKNESSNSSDKNDENIDDDKMFDIQDKLNINEVEIAEVSEANIVTPENNIISVAQKIKDKRIKYKKIKFRKLTHNTVKFSKGAILLSNLAINKQLSSDPSYQQKLRSLVILKTRSALKQDDEADLLISNSDYDDSANQEDSIDTASLNSNIEKIENNIESDEDDEDEYGSERILFTEQPHYFVDSFEKKRAVKTENVTELESINDSFEIEEIEIIDDDVIVTSSTNTKIKN